MKTRLPWVLTAFLFALSGCSVLQERNERSPQVSVFLSSGGNPVDDEDDPDILPYAQEATFTNRTNAPIWLVISVDDGLAYSFEYQASSNSQWTKGFQPNFESATSSVEVPPFSDMQLPVRTPLRLVKEHHRLLFDAYWRKSSGLVPAFTLIAYPDEPEKTEIVSCLPMDNAASFQKMVEGWPPDSLEPDSNRAEIVPFRDPDSSSCGYRTSANDEAECARKLIVEYMGSSWQTDETGLARVVDHFRVINRSESPIMIGGEGPGIPFSIYVLDNGSEAGDWDFPDINEFAVFFPLAPGDQWLFSKLRPDICYPWKFRVISVVECRNGRRQEFISDSQWVTKWESCQQ